MGLKESFKKVIGLDTETVIKDGVQKFYSFQVFSPELKLNTFSTDRDALRNLFVNSTQGCIIVCGNAEFDMSVIAPLLQEAGLTVQAIYTQSKLIKGKIKDNHRHTWHIIDIFALLPRGSGFGSIESIGNLIKFPKMEKPEYLGKREPLQHEMQDFVKYAMRDAEIAYYAARFLINEFGKIKATLPSLTMSLYRQQNPEMQFWHQPASSIHAKIQLAFKGARVESLHRGTYYDDVFAYDVRSLYPSIMSKGIFPDVTKEPEIKTSINFDHEGCALVTLQQDTLLPPLAIKHEIKDIGLRLLFPNGVIKSWFTYPELRYLELNGYGKIIKVHQSIEWKRKFNPFTKWIDYLFDKRAAYLQQNDERAALYKLLMNSLYGKFAQNLTSSTYEFFENGIKKIGEQGGMSKNTHFIIAAYITAQGRLRLHRYMMQNKGEDILYCDTDGFLTTKNNFATNDILGGLTKRFEDKPIQLTTLIRSKMYIIDNTVKMRGLLTKMDGMTLRSKILDGQMKFSKTIILKPRQAAAMHKEPLTMYAKSSLFSLKSDGKRDYSKQINNKNLITEFTNSQPVTVRIV